MAESFWTGISSILTLITLLTSCLLVLPVYYSLKEKKIKFRVLTSSKRTQERIFDAGALLLFIGILLGRNPGAEDLRCFGALFFGMEHHVMGFSTKKNPRYCSGSFDSIGVIDFDCLFDYDFYGQIKNSTGSNAAREDRKNSLY